MQIKTIWLILFLAIASLLVFQTFGLYNAFIIEKQAIEKNTNLIFRESVEKEVMIRYNMTDFKKGASYAGKLTTEQYSNFISGVEVIELDQHELREAGFYQQPAHIRGFPFEIQTLDSIFRYELQKEHLSDCFSLFYRDSTGAIIAQVDNLPESKIKKAYKTDALLIINGNRVQAYVFIAPPVVYKQMTLLLILSFIALIVLFFCIIFQTKTIFSQNKLDKLKEDFFNAFTHNIKTPLGTIKSVLSDLISGRLDNNPDKKEKFGKIAFIQVDNLQMLTERILTIAKLEAGQLKLNLFETDLNVMISELIDKYSVSHEKQVMINSSVDIPEETVVYLDTSLIKDAISNLLDNAVKYSGNSVEISIACSVINDTLHIRVADNGYGISAKDQHNIFKKFERGAAVDRKESKGFGVGLNYVKLVTELHGGKVSLSSKTGEGSEFTLSLPLPDSITLNFDKSID